MEVAQEGLPGLLEKQVIKDSLEHRVHRVFRVYKVHKVQVAAQVRPARQLLLSPWLLAIPIADLAE